jgi:SAM-dependent methyltransferase
VRVQYVDRLPVAELRLQYPELNAVPLTEADILDDGERLERIPDCSQDFVIANHFIEHCQDPIGTLQAMLRVTRPGGVLYLAIPDKRYTFDSERPITPLQHLLLDHVEGPAWSKRQHFEEWAQFVNHVSGAHAIRTEADRLIEMDYSVHYHVWTQAEILELVSMLHIRLQSFDLEVFVRNGIEVIVVLRKSQSTPNAN